MATLHLHGKMCEIDDEMSVLVAELNRHGLETIGCCSGHPDSHGGVPQGKYVAFRAGDVQVLLHNGIVSLHWAKE